MERSRSAPRPAYGEGKIQNLRLQDPRRSPAFSWSSLLMHAKARKRKSVLRNLCAHSKAFLATAFH